MPNLTPIPLTIEEHERLIAMKHRLEAGSWREMIMKLCDTYEETLKAEQPTKQEAKPEPETKPAEKTSLLSRLLEPTKKEGEKEVNEQDIRRIIREELQDHNFEVELPKEEEKPQEKLEPCAECGTPTKPSWKYCPTCGEEFDDSEETEE